MFVCLFVPVTATTQSVKALEMLRKNRNEFDLVISDVNMPEMDGFKLLQQVGLETDLPVISKHKNILSSHSFNLSIFCVFTEQKF